MITASKILHNFFCPIKTAARAIHPLPAEIFGTKELSLRQSIIPETAAKKADNSHAAILQSEDEIPLTSRTSSSDPVIRRYIPYGVLNKNKIAPSASNKAIATPEILTVAGANLKDSDTRTPRVLKNIQDKKDVKLEKSRFMAVAARKGFSFNFSVIKEKIRTRITQDKIERKAEIKIFWVKLKNAKVKKAERLMTPSMKTASIPAYSENKAPVDARRSGTAEKTNPKITFIFSPSKNNLKTEQ